jgi:hypothetical protein
VADGDVARLTASFDLQAHWARELQIACSTLTAWLWCPGRGTDRTCNQAVNSQTIYAWRLADVTLSGLHQGTVVLREPGWSGL